MSFMDERDLRRELEETGGFVTSFARSKARHMTEREIDRVVDDFERETGRWVSPSDRRRLHDARTGRAW
jgi:hypothetical protein